MRQFSRPVNDPIADIELSGKKRQRAIVAARVNGAPPKVTKQLPSFELQSTLASMAVLGGGIAGYSVVRGGSATYAVWLKSNDGRVRFMGVYQRELLPMFEVFTLSIATMEELEVQCRNWTPPKLPEDMPELFRTLASTRPAAPVAPFDFDPWPFKQWHTQVLRRAEFIIEDVPVGGIVGNNPNMQSAVRPMSVPPEASACCEVAVGVLFTGENGKRLLMGVDWMPENMVVTEATAKIEEYLKSCETLELAAYLERLSGHS